MYYIFYWKFLPDHTYPGGSSSLGLGPEQSFLGVISVLQVQVPVIGRVRLSNQPRLVQNLHHLLRERSLLQVSEVSLQLPETTHSNHNAIPAPIVDIEGRVVVNPAQRSLDQGETVLLNDRLDETEGFKVRILEVPLAIVSSHGVTLTVSSFCGHIVCLVFAREKTSGKGVIDDDVKAVASAGVDQFSLDVAGFMQEVKLVDGCQNTTGVRNKEPISRTNCVVHGLENGRTNPASLSAESANLCHLKGRIVAQAQLDKLALLVQLIDSLKSLGEWDGTIRCMEIEDVNLVGVQLLEGQLELLAHNGGLVVAIRAWIPFRGESEASLLPIRLGCPRFLFAADVDACSIDLIEALLLEVVQASLVFVKRGDSGALGLVRSKGHQPKDHSGLRVLCDQRHDDCVAELCIFGELERKRGEWRGCGES